MTIRKDLLAAGVVGAALAAIGCALLAPRQGAQKSPETTVNSELKTPPQAGAAKAAANDRDNSAAVEAVASPHSPAPPTRQIKRQNAIASSGRHTPRSRKEGGSVSHSPDALPPTASPSVAAPTADNPPPKQYTAEQARAALREVGVSAEAEAVWIAAINDAGMPADKRKDLIEDMNEEGFADPKHLTAADLPRIENRLALIEELAPDAIDQTNADAFDEAYKDLTNMRSKLRQP